MKPVDAYIKLFCEPYDCFGRKPNHPWIIWNPVVRPLTEEQHGWMETALNTVEWEWSTTRWPEGAEL